MFDDMSPLLTLLQALDRINELQARLDSALVGLRVIAAGGAAGKSDRDYATEVLEQSSMPQSGVDHE